MDYALVQRPKIEGLRTAGTFKFGIEEEYFLVDAETKGQNAARTACLAAPGRLAPLIGSIAAARACHLEILK